MREQILTKIKEAFVVELTQDEAKINLARTALLMSGYLQQTSEVTSYLTLLDEMAQITRPSIMAANTDLEIINVLNRHLFIDMNFSGNSTDYYHPNNSFLNKVIDLRMGIPISLCMIYLEVGWRLDLPVWGIGMPGHFIVGYGSPVNPIYIDVFNQGRILSEDDCLSIANVPSSGRLTFKEEFLKPATKKAILFRILLNVKQIYVDQEDWEAAYKIVDLMVVVRPDEITEIRDRGLLAYRLDRLHDAVFDIKRYLFLASDAVDAGWLEQRLELMEEQLIRLN